MMDVIHFYKTIDPFGCFSNFSAHPIFVDGQNWKTSEHYFQAQKFASPEVRHQIRMAGTPMRAAQLGRGRDNPLRADWDAIKDDVMRSVVRLKVEQHADVRDALTSTGGSLIVEHTTNDIYWADGGDGSGRNMLGVILMEVRAELAAGKLDEVAVCAPSPPWIKFPEFGKGGPGDLGFRMGGGQDYMDEWRDWFVGMSKKNRARYLTLFQVPSYWSDWLSSQN